VEKRSLIEWCERFAKPGPWRSIRSLRCWCRTRVSQTGELILDVAIRHELFAQIKADPRLVGLNANTFGRRAKRYGVGEVSEKERPHGTRAVVLATAFVQELTEGFADPVEGAAEFAGG
jgi:hypothetical protein